jgi:hypothetical protein
MPEAQSPAHYINRSKGCPSITESFPLCFLLVLCATVAALPVVEPHLGGDRGVLAEKEGPSPTLSSKAL